MNLSVSEMNTSMDDRWLLNEERTWIRPALIETQPPIEIMFISEISSLSRGSSRLLRYLVRKIISTTGVKPEIRWANLLSKIMDTRLNMGISAKIENNSASSPTGNALKSLGNCAISKPVSVRLNPLKWEKKGRNGMKNPIRIIRAQILEICSNFQTEGVFSCVDFGSDCWTDFSVIKEISFFSKPESSSGFS